MSLIRHTYSFIVKHFEIFYINGKRSINCSMSLFLLSVVVIVVVVVVVVVAAAAVLEVVVVVILLMLLLWMDALCHCLLKYWLFADLLQFF